MHIRATVHRWGLPALLIGVSLGGIWSGTQREETTRLHPEASPRQRWNTYDDRAKGGSSRLEVFDARDTLRAAIQTGLAPDAYWGIEWTPHGPGSLRWSWSPEDSLVFVWRARRATRQRIFLCSHDPALTSPGDPLSRRYLASDLPIEPEWSRTAVTLSDLEPPVWWLALRPGLPHPERPYLGSIVALQVSAASGTAGVPDTLEIASIDLVSRARVSWQVWVSLFGLVGSLILGLLPGRRRPASVLHAPVVSPPSGSQSLEPRPLEVPSPDLERLNRYLSEQYWREDLDLACVASELGLSARKVTSLLNRNGGSFKATLNHLRLQEARRLLLETELQVSEIAYKVGYTNVSHFNRLFRERFDTTPGTLRAGLRNPQNPAPNLQTEESGKDPPETD